MEKMESKIQDGARSQSLVKCVGTVAQVLRTYDKEHNVGTSYSHHKAALIDKDLQQLVTELIVNTPFIEMKGRKLKRFKLKDQPNEKRMS